MKLICSINQFGDFIMDLTQSNLVCLDTETTGLDYLNCILITIQVKINGNVYIFDCRKLDKKTTIYLVQLLSTKLCVGHNIKFDIQVLYNNTNVLLTNIYDTFIGEILILNKEGINRYPSLKDLVFKYFDIELEKEIRNQFIDNPNIELTQEILNYCAQDVIYLDGIKSYQEDVIKKQGQEATKDLERRFTPVLAMMEYTGILLDANGWNKVTEEVTEERNNAQQEVLDDIFNTIFSMKFENAYQACQVLNIPIKKSKKEEELLKSIADLTFIEDYIKQHLLITSPNQLKTILNNFYHIPVESTNEKIINKFANQFDIINKILFFREKEKQVTSFGDNFIKLINPKTGRIHTNYNQLGAVSGRMSSDNPNLSNIPSKNLVRNRFIVPEDWLFLGNDFSQEELRMMGLFEPKLAEAFRNKIDPHVNTGSWLFKVPVSEVTREQRKIGKNMNFGVGYGISEYGLYKNWNIPLEDGRKYLDIFYNQVYTSLRDTKVKVGDMVWKLGYSKTFLGRRRFFDIPSRFADNKEYARFRGKIEREGFNHIIQGSCSDVLKQALCDIFYSNPFGEALKILIQVYDEIDCEVHTPISEKGKEFVEEQMKKNLQYYLKDIPAEVSSYLGKCWIKE